MRLTLRMSLLLMLAPLMWAGNAVIGRLMVGQVPPLTLNFMRWSMTALLLLPLGWRCCGARFGPACWPSRVR